MLKIQAASCRNDECTVWCDDDDDDDDDAETGHVLYRESRQKGTDKNVLPSREHRRQGGTQKCFESHSTTLF
ncbi:unnamed protein product [Ascophyllum nodosum]